MTDENINEVREEEELKGGETNTIQKEIMDKIDKIRRQRIEQKNEYLKILNKHINKNRNKNRRKRKREYRLDDENVLEAEIIKEREEKLKESMRAF